MMVAFSREVLLAKLREAQQLAASIETLPKESEEGKYAILRWAVVGDETARLMMQAEEQLSPAKLARLKAEINGEGPIDYWRTYREGGWRLPFFGAPGPGDEKHTRPVAVMDLTRKKAGIENYGCAWPTCVRRVSQEIQRDAVLTVLQIERVPLF